MCSSLGVRLWVCHSHPLGTSWPPVTLMTWVSISGPIRRCMLMLTWDHCQQTMNHKWWRRHPPATAHRVSWSLWSVIVATVMRCSKQRITFQKITFISQLPLMPMDIVITQLALRRWPNVGIGRHRRDRQPTSRQRWYSVACVATVCWHSVSARRLAYRSLPMFCVWTSVVGIKCFSNKCCRSTRLSIHQLHI